MTLLLPRQQVLSRYKLQPTKLGSSTWGEDGRSSSSSSPTFLLTSDRTVDSGLSQLATSGTTPADSVLPSLLAALSTPTHSNRGEREGANISSLAPPATVRLRHLLSTLVPPSLLSTPVARSIIHPLKGERRKVLAATATFPFPRINTPSGIDIPVPHPTMRDICLLASRATYSSSPLRIQRRLAQSTPREYIRRQGF
jgi:hypothetical protein